MEGERRGGFSVVWSVGHIFLLERLGRNGLGEPEALGGVAAQGAHEVHLVFGLDALADDLVAQALDHVHDLLEEVKPPLVRGAAGEEAAVELHGVDGDIHDRVQKGVARAEIVQGGLHVLLLETGEQTLHTVKLGDGGGLGQLDL